MLLGTTVLLAFVLRCHRLGEVSYWFDESFCWKMTTFSWGDLVGRVALDNHPPLYFIILKAWIGAFGSSPIVLRGLSVLSGLATIVGGYCLVSQLERDRRPDRPQSAQITGLLAAAGLALAPMQIEWSQQLRMYAPGAALSVWSSYALVRALGTSTRPGSNWALYVVTAAALSYIHYFGLLVIAAQFLYSVGVCLFGKSPGTRSGENLSRAAISFLIIGMIWSPWLPEFLAHRQQVTRSFWTRPLELQNLVTACFQMWAGTWSEWHPEDRVAWIVAGISVATWTVQLAFGSGQRLLAIVPLTTFALATIASLLGRNIVSARYFLFAQTLAVCALAAATQRLPTGWLKGLAAGVMLVGFSWLSVSVVERRDRWAARPGFQSAVAYIEEFRKPGEPIFVSNPMVQITTAAYVEPGAEVYVLSSSTNFPYFQGTAVMRESEYVTPASVAEWPSERIWTIDTVNWTGGTSRVALPRPWIDLREEAFYDWYRPGSQLVVKECARPRQASSPPRQE